MSRFVELHESFEARNPADAEMAKRYADHAAAMHLRARGTMDGYRPPRSFPCPGALRAVDTDESGISTVQCDACGWESTARLTDREPVEARPF